MVRLKTHEQHGKSHDRSFFILYTSILFSFIRSRSLFRRSVVLTASISTVTVLLILGYCFWTIELLKRYDDKMVERARRVSNRCGAIRERSICCCFFENEKLSWNTLRNFSVSTGIAKALHLYLWDQSYSPTLKSISLTICSIMSRKFVSICIFGRICKYDIVFIDTEGIEQRRSSLFSRKA